MADKVKRGFGFYLFMLLLVLLAAFLVIVMIMLFSPGKSILGYKYFSYSTDGNKAIVKTETTDASPVALDFDTIDGIIVSSDYASVKIDKSNTENSKDSVIITNTAKGFARDGEDINTEFSYSITYSNETTESGIKSLLNISVTEPEGFLFFSKNIVIEISLRKDSQTNFSNSDFVITTTSGKVSVDENYSGLAIKDLTVTTNSGNIALAEKREYDKSEVNEETKEVTVNKTMTFNSLYLSTTSGKVSTTTHLSVNNMAKFTIDGRGTVELKNIKDNNGLQLAINDGTFSADQIQGNVSILSFKNGSVVIGDSEDANSGIYGMLESNDAKAFENGKIDISFVRGDVSIPYGGKANITFQRIENQALIRTTTGNIVIKELKGPSIIETTSGNIDVVANDTDFAGKFAYMNAKLAHRFESQTGKIKVRFSKNVDTISEFRTNGDIEIELPKNTKFLLDLRDKDEKPIQELSSTVTINFIDNYKYPFMVNYENGDNQEIYTENKMMVFGGGRIDVHMIDDKN